MLSERYLRNETSKLIDLLIKKNTDYGSSFDKAMDKFGGISFIVRLFDKFGRLESIFDSKQILVADEGVEDTVNDIIGYCLLYKHYCMVKKKYNNNLEEWNNINDKTGINDMENFHNNKIVINKDDMIADKKNKIYTYGEFSQ